MRTLKDWPVGTKGKTTTGYAYQVVWHDDIEDDMPLLVVLNRTLTAWVRVDGKIEGEIDGKIECGITELIHPDDELIRPNFELIDIRGDLTNPGKVPVRKLTMESRAALAEAGWERLDMLDCCGWRASENRHPAMPLTDKQGAARYGNSVYRLRPAPEDKPIDSRGDLTSPGEVPVRKLTTESRQALAEAPVPDTARREIVVHYSRGRFTSRLLPAPKMRLMDTKECQPKVEVQP